MNRLLAAGLCLLLAVELTAIFAQPDRRLVLWASGAAVALTLVAVRRFLDDDVEFVPIEPTSKDPAESLRRWMSRTENMIRWSESTRRDWDRHLRPKLAREFGMATGERQAKDPVAFDATGRMLFGTELWAWVDPGNVSRSGGSEPAPGRAALEEILQRLERV